MDTKRSATVPSSQSRPADWWIPELRPGQAVELTVYGERLSGRLISLKDNVLEVDVPIKQQSALLRSSTAQGSAEISIDGGAAVAPVSCWPVGDSVRMRVIGTVELVQRRMHVRANLDVPVVLTWPGERGTGLQRVMARTSDISIGGLRLQPANTVWPSAGGAVSALIDLPSGPVQVDALALGKTPDYGLRLQFTQIGDGAAAAIAQCVTAVAGRI